MSKAHKKAYEIIKNARPDEQVGIALNVMDFKGEGTLGNVVAIL